MTADLTASALGLTRLDLDHGRRRVRQESPAANPHELELHALIILLPLQLRQPPVTVVAAVVGAPPNPSSDHQHSETA